LNGCCGHTRTLTSPTVAKATRTRRKLRACYEVTVASKNDSAQPKKKKMAERSEDIENICVLSLSLGTFLSGTFLSLYIAIKEKEMYKLKNNLKIKIIHQNIYLGILVILYIKCNNL